MTAKLALPWEPRVVVRWFGQSAPVFTTAPPTMLGPRILTLPQSLTMTALSDQADRYGPPG